MNQWVINDLHWFTATQKPHLCYRKAAVSATQKPHTCYRKAAPVSYQNSIEIDPATIAKLFRQHFFIFF